MQEPSSDKRLHRLEFIDAARGIAAVAVVLYHILNEAGPMLARWMKEKENLGSFGVIVFFYISGFIIPVSLERKRLGEFWRARCFRLLPAYWLALLLTLLFGVLALVPLPPEFHHWSLRRAITTTFMLPGKPGEQLLLGVSWTLSIELFFYVLCSMLKIASLLTRRLLLAWGSIVVYLLLLAAARMHLYAPHHFKGDWGGLLIAAYVGSVFYSVAKDQHATRVLVPLVPTAVATILVGIRFQYVVGDPPGPISASWILATVFFVLMFCMRYRTFPEPVLWLGRISYSVYLLHTLVAELIFYRLKDLWGLTASTVITLAAVLLVSDLPYRWVELPFSKFGSRQQRVAT